jgi:putative flippase GtrA
MSRKSWLPRITAVRFGAVSLVNEAIYFILYWLTLRLTNNTIATLTIAGALCILLNAYAHARITFQVRFHWRLLLGYLQIQVLGFLLSFLVGILAKTGGAGDLLIALLTYSIWALVSFLLTYRLFQSPFVAAAVPKAAREAAPLVCLTPKD